MQDKTLLLTNPLFGSIIFLIRDSGDAGMCVSAMPADEQEKKLVIYLCFQAWGDLSGSFSGDHHFEDPVPQCFIPAELCQLSESQVIT